MDYPIQLANQLSQHLRSFRQHRKMTQLQLAQSLGLTQSRIAEIEADPGKVSLENLLKILSALDIQMVLQDRQDRSKLGIAQLKVPNQDQKAQTPGGLELLQLIKKNPPSGGSW